MAAEPVHAIKSRLRRYTAISFALSESLLGFLWIVIPILRAYSFRHFFLALLTSALVLPLALRSVSNVVKAMSSTPWTPVFSLWFLGLFLPEIVVAQAPSSSLIPATAALIFAVLEASVLKPKLQFTRSDIRAESQPDSPHGILIGWMVLYFCISSFLALWKLRAFGYVGQDIAYFMQCLYSTLHGHLFYANQYHDLLYSHPVWSDFAGHNQLVLFLLAPLYGAFPHAETLLLSRNLVVTLCALPLYRIARLYFDKVPALVLTIACMIAPAFLGQMMYDYAPLSLAGLPLLLAIESLLTYRKVRFYVCLAVLLIIREDLIFAVAGLGMWALLRKRNWTWWAPSFLLAGGWAILTWKLVFPHFLQGATSAVGACFVDLGNTPGAMLSSIIHHPELIFYRDTGTYLRGIMAPAGLFPAFASPAGLMALPYIAINMLGSRGCDSAIVFRHYSLIPFLLLFVGSIITLSHVSRYLSHRVQIHANTQRCFSFLLLFASATSLVIAVGSSELEAWHSAPWHSEARQLPHYIPQQASVAVPRYMLPSVANRAGVYQSLRLLEYSHPDASYIVIDKDWTRMHASLRWKPEYDELKEQLEHNPGFDVIYDSSNYRIYRRTTGHLVSNREISGNE